MRTDRLTTKKYWTEQASIFKPFKVGANELTSKLRNYLPFNSEFTCVEIGAYPGAYLCYLAKTFGYKPTAIEYRDDADDIRRLFEFNRVENLNLIKKDFFNINDLTFDVVTSFGFVEHFENYENVIRRHIDFVKPGGYLVLSVPHLWGLQYLLRKLTYKECVFNEIMRLHNLKIMNKQELKKVLLRNDMKIILAYHAMGAKFWVSHNSSKIKTGCKSLVKLYNDFYKKALRYLPSCALYSPMIVVIAQKPFPKC